MFNFFPDLEVESMLFFESWIKMLKKEGNRINSAE